MQISYLMYCNHTGYSIAAQEYVLSMIHLDTNIDIKCEFLNQINNIGISKERQNLFTALKNKPSSSIQTMFFHCIPNRYRRPRGPKKFIGMSLFETMNPPKNWIDTMNEMDIIITASQFNKRIFETNGLKKPVYVIPHTFDTNMFNKEIKHKGRYNLFTFMAMGTWKQRKNWSTLIKAFYNAFNKNDNVCLLIKTDKPEELKKMVIDIKQNSEWRSKDTAPIYSEEKDKCTFEEIPTIMSKADCYINISLGEGFGYSGLHAMALGIPTITTKYGGVLEYAKSDHCTLIEPKHYQTYPTMDAIPQFQNCIWPVYRINDVSEKMVYVFKNYNKDIKEKAMRAYKYVHENFNYSIIGKQLIKVLGI